MASGPIERGLEQVFRVYGRILRGVAEVVPGDGATRALDNTAEVLRRALDIPTAREVGPGAEPDRDRSASEPTAAVPSPPGSDPAVESAAAAAVSESEVADLEGSARTAEFDAVDEEATPARPFSYSIPRPGESGRKGTIFATYQAEIAAPIERCWDVAADVVNAVEWTPLLLEAKVAPENSTDVPTVFDTVGDAKVRKTKAKLRFEFDRPRGMRWEQLEGDQKYLIGAWEFEPVGSGNVRATYLVETDLGRALGLVIRGPALNWVKDMLTRGSVEGLKEKVE